MSDTGTLVTDAEVRARIPAIQEIGELERLVILAAEQLIQNYCGNTFASTGPTTYTDESIDIDRGELRYSGIITVYRKDFFVKHRPITEWTGLKQVVSRNATTGAPQETMTIPRDAYIVDFDLGAVSLLQPLTVYQDANLQISGLQSSWPTGKGILLATYKAGMAATAGGGTSGVPAQVKEAVLEQIDRDWHLATMQLHHVQSAGGEVTGNVTPVHVGLSDRQKQLLSAYVSGTGFA